VGAKAIWREDLITSLLSILLVAGLFLDGWNHINLQNGALGGFFTVWHGLLYLGFNATAMWVVSRNPHLYTRRAKPAPYLHPVLGIPLRYPLAVGGLALAGIGLFGDLVWHTAFGEETGVARVIAPFHLFLFAGAAGLASAPLRSAWYAPGFYGANSSFRRLLPPLLALTLVTCVASFMFQWLNAFIDWTPSVQIGRVPADLVANARVRGTTEYAGAARVLFTNLILLAPGAIRSNMGGSLDSGIGAVNGGRARSNNFLIDGLQNNDISVTGSAPLLFVGVSFSMSSLTSFDLGATVVAALIGGLVADAVIDRYQPDAHRTTGYRVMAGVTPLALWASYFLILRSVYGIEWPFDLWLGTTALAAISGLLLSYVAISPVVPEPMTEGGIPAPEGALDVGGGGS